MVSHEENARLISAFICRKVILGFNTNKLFSDHVILYYIVVMEISVGMTRFLFVYFKQLHFFRYEKEKISIGRNSQIST